jgi:hypothetical protein
MMRAKMQCTSVEPLGDGEVLNFSCVSKSDGPYPADGLDENNSFARWSPDGGSRINVQNPALKGKIKAGDTFYVDFTLVAPPPPADPVTQNGVTKFQG